MKRWFGKREEGNGGGSESRLPSRGSLRDWRSFEGVADRYTRTLALHTREIAADLFTETRVEPGARVLDVGTGPGHATALAHDLTGGDGLAVGVDLSPAMLAAGPEPRPALAAAEAINLPFADATFDVVTASFVLPFFAKLDTALFDLIRVLRPGGRLGVATWERSSDELTSTWIGLVEGTVGVEVLRGALKEAKPWVHHTDDRERLEGVLRDAGLRPVTVSRHTYRFEMTREDYIEAQGTGVEGRFVHSMLGDAGWERFRSRASDAFAQRFGEHIVDFRTVLLAVGTKP